MVSEQYSYSLTSSELSKRVFLESPFLPCPRKVCPYKHLKDPENLKGQSRNALSKTPFWTTVSPHDAFAAPLARPHKPKRIGNKASDTILRPLLGEIDVCTPPVLGGAGPSDNSAPAVF